MKANTTLHANEFISDRRPQAQWQRYVLLGVLIYETAGCLLGGLLLILAPDGSYLQMPTSIMHGFFPNFLAPGFILSGLGILNALAFISVRNRLPNDWLTAMLALGGLLIWLVVEIAVLRELHWLHAMWGLPVLMGWVATIPLLSIRVNTDAVTSVLLSCGGASSLWYLVVNVLMSVLDGKYDLFSQTVSEFSAIGAPTRIAWVLLMIPYALLLAAFGWGVSLAGENKNNIRRAGYLIVLYGVFNFYWPPMHQRDVLAAGGSALTDQLHIVWAVIALIFSMAIMGLSAASFGRRFQIYTGVTYAAFIAFGTLTFMESGGVMANTPTPYIGIWERINIIAFLLWIAIFATEVRRQQKL